MTDRSRVAVTIDSLAARGLDRAADEVRDAISARIGTALENGHGAAPDWSHEQVAAVVVDAVQRELEGGSDG